MTSTFYEISIRFLKGGAGAEEALKQVFFRLGYDPSMLTVTFEQPYGYIQVYCKTPRQAKRLFDRLTALRLKKVKIFQKYSKAHLLILPVNIWAFKM